MVNIPELAREKKALYFEEATSDPEDPSTTISTLKFETGQGPKVLNDLEMSRL